MGRKCSVLADRRVSSPFRIARLAYHRTSPSSRLAMLSLSSNHVGASVALPIGRAFVASWWSGVVSQREAGCALAPALFGCLAFQTWVAPSDPAWGYVIASVAGCSLSPLPVAVPSLYFFALR